MSKKSQIKNTKRNEKKNMDSSKDEMIINDRSDKAPRHAGIE